MFKKPLYDICLLRSWKKPEYVTTKEGPDHCPSFTSTVTVNSVSFQHSAPSRTIKESQNRAAEMAYNHFHQPTPNPNPSPISSPRRPSSSAPPKSSLSLQASTFSGSFDSDTNSENIIMTGVLEPNQPKEWQTSQVNSPAITKHGEQNAYKNMTKWYKCKLNEYSHKKKICPPAYSSELEGPPHLPLFKCKVTVDGKTYESHEYFHTMKEAESAAARVALLSLDPNVALEVSYKNLLRGLLVEEGLNLPVYLTESSGTASEPPVFVCNVLCEGQKFTGEEAKTKKKAEMNAAKVAYTCLKKRNRDEYEC